MWYKKWKHLKLTFPEARVYQENELDFFIVRLRVMLFISPITT